MSQQVTINNFFKGRVSIPTIIDFVEKKLLEQGKRSIGEYGNCLYRGEDNCKCGVGHLIPDSRYNPKFDQGIVGAGTLIREFRDELGVVVPETHDKDFVRKVYFLQELQRAHDDCGLTSSTFAEQLQPRMDELRREFVDNTK
jgi:hypothetical protein